MATEANFENDNVTIGNATVTTYITASTFTGDGSGITNPPSASPIVFACKTTLLNSTAINNTTSYTQLSVFPASFVFNVGGFTMTSAGITVPETGVYLCLANVKEFSTSERPNAAVKFTINGTAQTQTGASGYIRNLGNHSSSSVHLDTIYSLTVGDEIGLAFASLANNGTVNLTGANSSVCLYRVV